jgi:PEP-CTERM motif
MKTGLVVTGAALALAFANLASANVIVFDNPTVFAGSGIYTGDFGYTYLVQLDGQQQFQGYPITNGSPATNEEYCISNIDGLIGGSASIVATPGFTVSQGNSGGCNINAGTLVGQNVGPWVEVLYTGSTTYGPSTTLPSITFYSIYPENSGPNTAYGGSAYNKTANGTGTVFNPTTNQGEITGPESNVPEPATMTLFGSALLGIGFFARKRAKKN